MDDFVLMNVIEAVQELLDDTLDLRQGESHLVVGQKTSQVVVAKVKDQVKSRLEPVDDGGLGAADLNQVDNVVVAKLLEDSHLKKVILVVGRDSNPQAVFCFE